VATAAHREVEPLLAGEIHRGHHIGDATAAGNDGWRSVDQAIAHPARVVIVGISGLYQGASETSCQLGNRPGISSWNVFHGNHLVPLQPSDPLVTHPPGAGRREKRCEGDGSASRLR
jgi:hypothetical protein